MHCGCWQRFKVDIAVINSVVVCLRHGETHIVKVNAYEWHVKCQHPKCRYSRWVGASKDEAERLANRHKLGHPSHYLATAFDLVTWDGKGTMLRDTVFDGKVIRRPTADSYSARKPTIRVDAEPPY